MPISLEIQYHSLYYVLFVREWSKGNDYPQAGMRGSKGAWHLIDKQTNESCIFADNLCYNSCQEDFHHILGKMMNFLSKSYSQEGKSKLSYARTAFWIMVIDKKELIFCVKLCLQFFNLLSPLEEIMLPDSDTNSDFKL